MSDEITRLLSEISASQIAGSFAVRRLADSSCYFAGRNEAGCAALLVKSSGQGRSVPLRLAGIEARFDVQCQIAEPNAPRRTETLTMILCRSCDLTIEAYFSAILQSLIGVLGPSPSTDQVYEAVQELVDLFQKLQAAPRRSLTGLVGELCIVLVAADAAAAIAAWRVDPDERFDFVAANLQLDVKASSNRRRSHEVTFEQANPPPATVGLFASIWIETAGGGCSLSELLGMIEKRLAGHTGAASKLRSVVADTLGNTLPTAMDWRFDLPLAKSSLLLFEAAKVPALRPPLPSGISAMRFVSDFGQALPASMEVLGKILRSGEAMVLPS